MKKIIVLFLIFLPFGLFASPSSDLQHRLANLKSFTANFQQIIYAKDGSVLQNSSGNLAVSRPGKFRWQVTQPSSQLIVTDGIKLWIYDVDLSQVTVRKLGNSIGQTPILLLTSSQINLAKQFNVKKQGEVFTVSPHKSEKDFTSVQLTFHNNLLTNMKLKTGLGQSSELRFSNVKVNPALSPRLFSFVAPKGVDVVQQ